MKFVLIFFSILNFSYAEDCKIELFSKIYKLEASQILSSKDVVYKSTCASDINAKITQVISNASGIIPSSILENELANKNVTISPRKISIFELNTTLKDQLSSATNLYFFNTHSLNQVSTLSLTEGETAKAACESCVAVGEKNIKVDVINPIANTSRTLWFTSKIFEKIKVLKAKRNLGFQEKSLSQEDFYYDETFTTMPQNILSNLDNIQFYKPNKTITTGSIITTMDLQAVNLVTYGTPVKLMLKNQNINLSNNAMPARSAQFGEAIEVQTTSNRKLLGRVIDYNKVVIEL